MDIATGFTFNDDCGYLGVGRAGSIPFVSEKPGAYGRLLLAVYVRWRSGLLISSDWLRPVTRGAWRAVLPDRAEEPNCGYSVLIGVPSCSDTYVIWTGTIWCVC